MSGPLLYPFGPLFLDPAQFSSQGTAVLGIRGSGKSYTATCLAELMHEAGVPFIAFDPIGVWRFLRVPGKGEGIPVVVAGGQAGDLPLTVASAPEIVRAAMANGVSLVIDLFDINLSKADWKRIVSSCVRVLLHENAAHGLRHVFIEEAAEFAPQRVGPDQGVVYAEIEKLARMGGNARLGYTLINQRAEEVNKAVLELCDNLFLHRQKGRNSLQALAKWLDVGNADNAKEIVASMATLPTGQCWAWLGEAERPQLITVPTKNSLHPDRSVMRGDVAIEAKAAVDVGGFVAAMRTALEVAPADAPAELASKLRARVRELEADVAALHTAVDEAEGRGYRRGLSIGITRARAAIDALRVDDEPAPADATSPPPSEVVQPAARVPNRGWGNALQQGHRAKTKQPRPPRSAPNFAVPVGEAVEGAQLTGPQLKIVRALAMWHALGHDMPTKQMVALCAGYSPTSTSFTNPLGALRSAGLITYPAPGQIALVGAADPIEPGAAWVTIWDGLSGPERKILSAVPPEGATDKPGLAGAAGYSPTSTSFTNPLGHLRSLGLITYPQAGQVALADWVADVMAL